MERDHSILLLSAGSDFAVVFFCAASVFHFCTTGSGWLNYIGTDESVKKYKTQPLLSGSCRSQIQLRAAFYSLVVRR
jgi:hypothetical protein